MCMTADAMILFLSVLSQDLIEATPDRIVILADRGAAQWELTGDVWCTEGGGEQAVFTLDSYPAR